MFHAFHACTVGDLAKNQSADLQSWEKLSEVITGKVSFAASFLERRRRDVNQSGGPVPSEQAM